MGNSLRDGNIERMGLVRVTFNAASVAAATSAEQSITVPGLQVGDYVDINKEAFNAGLGIIDARVSAANTLTVTYMNATAGAIDPASQTLLLLWMRSDESDPAVLPASVAI